MRRILGASASRMCGRVCAVPLIAALLLATPGLGTAQPAPTDDIAALVAQIAEVDQKLQDLGAAIQQKQESVNKAIVDLQKAREDADAAQREVEAAKRRVEDANTAIAAAQQRFNKFAAAVYVNGPPSSYLLASDPGDVIRTAAAGEAMALASQKVINDLKRARTDAVNQESAARLAKQKADQAVADAEASQQAAVNALTDAQDTFRRQQEELDRLKAERNAVKARLEQARASSAPARGAPAQPGDAAGPAAPAAADWDRAPQGQRGGDWALWDPTLPAIPSAFVSGDPIAIINAVLGIAATSAQVTADLGRKFMQRIGLIPTPTGYTNGVRHPAGDVAARRALLVGRRQRRRPQPRYRIGRQHRRVRLFGPDALRVRRRGHQARALLRLAVQRRAQGADGPDAPGRHVVLGPRRQPARRALSR